METSVNDIFILADMEILPWEQKKNTISGDPSSDNGEASKTNIFDQRWNFFHKNTQEIRLFWESARSS